MVTVGDKVVAEKLDKLRLRIRRVLRHTGAAPNGCGSIESVYEREKIIFKGSLAAFDVWWRRCGINHGDILEVRPIVNDGEPVAWSPMTMEELIREVQSRSV